MIFKRAVAGLRGQDWLAITSSSHRDHWRLHRYPGRQLERGASRAARDSADADTAQARTSLPPRPLRQCAHVLRDDTGLCSNRICRVAKRPQVSDRDFVIAAYQASQIYATAINNATWATIFGADRLRTIDDSLIRNNLAFLMYSDTTQIDTEAVNTPYRQNVRRVIPVEIQDAIRAECGDRRPPDNPQLWFLPKSCDLDVPPAAAATAAAALRARPQLVDDLRWHTAAAAAFLANIDTFEKKTSKLKEQIDSLE